MEVSADVAVHDGRFFENPESVFPVHFHQESGVDVGVSVLTPIDNVHDNIYNISLWLYSKRDQKTRKLNTTI